MAYVIIWKYRVLTEFVERFVEAYGPRGAWAAFFQLGTGYLRTDLIRGEEPGTFLTLDWWRSEAEYKGFVAAHRDGYFRLDRDFEAWTQSEERIAAGTVDTA